MPLREGAVEKDFLRPRDMDYVFRSSPWAKQPAPSRGARAGPSTLTLSTAFPKILAWSWT